MSINIFDPIPYMQTLHSKLKITKNDYLFARVSGINDLEEILENSKRQSKFFAIDDSQDGVTVMGGGAGYFERRLYTVFILQRAKLGDMAIRANILAESRTIFRAIQSRMIRDRQAIQFLDLSRMAFYEVAPNFAQGTCGLYFTFEVNNPVDLRYDATAWDS